MTPVCFSLALHVIGLQIIFIFTNLDPNCIITLHPYSTFMFSKHFIYSILPLQQPCELTISSASCCFVRKLRLLCYARDQPSITWSWSSGAEMSSWPPDCPGLPPLHCGAWALGEESGAGPSPATVCFFTTSGFQVMRSIAFSPGNTSCLLLSFIMRAKDLLQA